MTRPWIKADAWFRREVGDGSFLTVSKHKAGGWSYRWTDAKGGPLASSRVYRFDTAQAAMGVADGIVAAVLATEATTELTTGPTEGTGRG